ncbi:MAG: glycosyltransferase [Clostridia bacterium]|nr:glycosyltransferase [Clostridia bacterium]
MRNKYPAFSVLFSVYYKEKPEFFDKALESIYNQTVKADEWVIVKDGPIPQGLQDVIDKYKSYDGVVIKEVQLEENKGLGLALSYGVPECSYELIARMDTDDIAVANRFELQLAEFEKNPDLDLCGGQIIEFETDENIPVAERRVPLTQEEIVKFQKQRSAFNHMTVMFKKSKVLEAGNYKDCPLMEDDMLWVDMILAGANCMNVDEYLCNVRTNRDMIVRRGGLKYYKKYKNARKQILDTGFITKKQYRKTNRIQWIVCIMPKWLRKFIFFKLLHKKVNNQQQMNGSV